MAGWFRKVPLETLAPDFPPPSVLVSLNSVMVVRAGLAWNAFARNASACW